jgi:hypothetical protein
MNFLKKLFRFRTKKSCCGTEGSPDGTCQCTVCTCGANCCTPGKTEAAKAAQAEKPAPKHACCE